MIIIHLKFINNKHIKNILNSIDDGIQIIDLNGNIVFSNDTALELEGLSDKDVIGKHILKVYPSLNKKTSTLLRAMENNKSYEEVKQEFVNFKGKKISTINTSMPLNEDNNIIGAIEISKNITDVKRLSERVVELQKELLEESYNKKKISETFNKKLYRFKDIIGDSKAIKNIINKGKSIADTDTQILVYGSTGTGKELFVQSIHSYSYRKKGPFIAQNCAAIPESLLESLLFGTIKGSYTGAENRAGLFRLANGGTLFLDELNSMNFNLQSKILRAIEEKKIRPVGSNKEYDIDVRIIAAMNVDPYYALKHNIIRKDLFYRLCVLSFKIPDLKDRKEDIPTLVYYFINKFNRSLNKNIRYIEKDLYSILLKYNWPGNIRELENIIESSISFVESNTLLLDDLPNYILKEMQENTNIKLEEKKSNAIIKVEDLRQVNDSKLKEYDKSNYKNKSNGIRRFKVKRNQLFINYNKRFENENNLDLKKILEIKEKYIIKDVLIKNQNNISQTAKKLNIPRQTLQYKIKKYGLDNQDA